MKKLLIGLLGIVAVLLLAYGVTYGLARNAESKADRMFAAIAPGAMESGYPLVPAKNESAARLERLATPLAIDIRPRAEHTMDGPALDPALRDSMTAWLRAQQERPDDVIEPLPSDVSAWLDANRAPVDAVAAFLAASDVPRWPMVDPASVARVQDQPIPNLLGHMHLFRVMCIAGLERASRGDQAAAWEALHAASNLSRGIRERRELISQLIAVAGVRMIAATARKLEPPVPAWFAGLAEPRLYDSVFDAIRFETLRSAAAIRDPWFDFALEETGRKSGTVEGLAMRVALPFIRWSFASTQAAFGEQMAGLQTAEPCSIDSGAMDARIEASLPSFPPRFQADLLPRLANALSRAASADVAVEGTSRILALKAARNADPLRAWPASFASDSSICTDAQWAYQRGPDGTALLQFTGRVDMPPGFIGPKIPLEYRGAPPPAKTVSGN
ncbi:MAG: hypothetical protein ACYC7A_11275 [Thermoanaerobaculia bacterium]